MLNYTLFEGKDGVSSSSLLMRAVSQGSGATHCRTELTVCPQYEDQLQTLEDWQRLEKLSRARQDAIRVRGVVSAHGAST